MLLADHFIVKTMEYFSPMFVIVDMVLLYLYRALVLSLGDLKAYLREQAFVLTSSYVSTDVCCRLYFLRTWAKA